MAVEQDELTKRDALDRVLEAAERRANEILGQASNYERLARTSPPGGLGMKYPDEGHLKTAEETYEKHYKPLRQAIDVVKASVRPTL